MRKMLLVALFAATALMQNANAQCVVSDAVNPGPGVPLDQRTSAAQFFTASCSGALSFIELKMDVFMSFSGTVYVYAGNVTVFNTATAIASQNYSVPNPSMGGSSFTINFANPASVISGNTYTFRVVNAGMDPAVLFASHNPSVSATAVGIDNLSGSVRPMPFNIYHVINIGAAVSTMPVISGPSTVCTGSSINLSASVAGGVWSTQQTSQATINASTGVLTGKNAGGVIVQYKVMSGGVLKTATYNVNVNSIPAVPTITYAPGTTSNPQAGAPTGSFCVGKTFSVVGTPNVPAGVWSSTGVVGVTSGGVVTINAVGAGSIKYTYTNANGCSNSRTMSGNGFTCAARGVNTVDGQQSSVDGITMYPNPAKGFINLNVETLVGKGSIVVTDLYGKAVKTQNLSMGTNNVNIANLSKGFYLVSIITEQGKTTKKLVVE